MTDAQRKLARHALGLPNKKNVSYRNRFYAGSGHDDMGVINSMILDKYITLTSSDGQSARFELTIAGAKLALDKGEYLDVEDFPV